MAAKEGVFSVGGEPSYNSCDEYINELLDKVVRILHKYGGIVYITGFFPPGEG